MVKNEELDVDVADVLPAAPAVAPPVAEPAPFEGGDVVPLFRTDLRVARGASPSLFDVSDPASGRKFTLYEFELAIARMLDGRRKVSDVIESGGRLGIPMDVVALYKFVRQMWHYGFLAVPGAEGAPASDGEGGTWNEREAWDDATRSLFETGQRLMRLGRNSDAASYFEAVLDSHPENAAAAEMLALVAKGRSLAAGPLGDTRPPAATAAGPFDAAAAGAAPGASARPRRTVGAVAATVAILAAGTVAWVLLRPASRPPSPPLAAVPVAPAAAPVAPPAPPPPAWRSAAVERRGHPELAAVAAPGDGTFTWSGAPDDEVASGERLGTMKVEVSAKPANPALARRIAELERLAAQDPVYRDFLEKARRDQRRAAARKQTRSVALVAPAAGRLSRAPEPGGRAASGEILARVVDAGVWHLGLAPGAEPAPDAACEVVGDAPADRAGCRVVARGAELVAEISAADAPWLARAASLHVLLAAPGTRPRRPPSLPEPAP